MQCFSSCGGAINDSFEIILVIEQLSGPQPPTSAYKYILGETLRGKPDSQASRRAPFVDNFPSVTVHSSSSSIAIDRSHLYPGKALDYSYLTLQHHAWCCHSTSQTVSEIPQPLTVNNQVRESTRKCENSHIGDWTTSVTKELSRNR